LENILQRFAHEIPDAVLADIIESLGERTGFLKLKGAVTAMKGKRMPAQKALPKGQKRSPEALHQLELQLAQYIAKHPGQRIEQIGQAMGVSTKELALPVRKLIASKQVKTKGQKRATTYTSAK